MNWKYLFEDRILDRGFGYYSSGFIDEYNVQDGEIKAVVHGSDDYNVNIEIENNEIGYMYCDCPYADDGNNCKHMAAVLYKYELEKNIDVQKDYPSINVEELIDKSDAEDMKIFLKKALKTDLKLKEKYIQFVNRNSENIDINLLYKKIDNIIDEYVGYEEYILYEDTIDFENEIIDFINEDIANAFSRGLYEESYKIIIYLINGLENIFFEECTSDSMLLCDDCYDIMISLIDMPNSDYKIQFKEYMISLLKTGACDMVYELSYMTLRHIMGEDKLLDFEIELCKEKIKNCNENSYELQNRVEKLIHLLTEKHEEPDGIEKVYKEYWNMDSIKRMYIEKCISEKQYDFAVKIINENFEDLDGKYSAYKLRDIYKIQGKTDEYKNQLYLLLYKYDVGNIKIFEELKECYSQHEWLNKRESIFERLKDYHGLHELYHREKMYDRLLEFIQKSGAYTVKYYVDDLKKIYPNEVFDLYKTIVLQSARLPNGREHYRAIVKDLNFMLTLENSKEKVAEIVELFKMGYKGRPAMQDELRKVKI